jgi:hypothetical protein
MNTGKCAHAQVAAVKKRKNLYCTSVQYFAFYGQFTVNIVGKLSIFGVKMGKK